MFENDIRELDERALDHSLDQLEADIWRGVAARNRQRQTARRVTSFQGCVMALGLLGSVAAGISLARSGGATGAESVLTAGSELMPSSLLLGERP
jgi:hypothetical protein